MDAQTLYTQKVDDYISFVSAFSHQQGIAALLLAQGLLRDGMRVLDAGCGTGFSSLAVLDALGRRGLSVRKIDAFDLTPAMLARFEQTVRTRGLTNVELRQASVLNLAALPPTWTGYDLIISVSMLEYVPRTELPTALRELRARLAPGGQMVIVITRRNPITRLVIEKPWHARRYTRTEFGAALAAADCNEVRFTRFPARYFCLSLSNHVAVVSAGGVHRAHAASGAPAGHLR